MYECMNTIFVCLYLFIDFTLFVLVNFDMYAECNIRKQFSIGLSNVNMGFSQMLTVSIPYLHIKYLYTEHNFILNKL